jgi:hypothetical protein
VVSKHVRSKKRCLYPAVLCSFLILIVACAHRVSVKQSAPTFAFLQSEASKSFKSVSYAGIEQKIRRFEGYLRRGMATSNAAFVLHDELLEAYINLKKSSASRIAVPAQSQKRIPLHSFCLNSGKASPSPNEHYRWVKRRPDIPYYREVLDYWFRHQKIPQKNVQTLLWNLESETHFERYSPGLQRILLGIDKNAPLKLPSDVKSRIADFAGGMLQGVVPGIVTARDAFHWVKGHYRDYGEIADSIRTLRSKESIPSTDQPQIVESSPLFAETDSDGFSSVEATLYNPSDEEVTIDVADYYLEPSRTDVQSIGILPKGPFPERILAELERVLYGDMARLGIGFVPVLNDVADLYELVTGKDYVSGLSLSVSDRAMAGVGLIIGSGANYRWMKRAANSPAEYLPKFENGLAIVSGRAVANFDQRVSQLAISQGETAVARIRKSPTLRKIAEGAHFKKTDFYARPNGDVIPARGYRYVSSDAPYVDQLLRDGTIPPNPKGTYISFDNYEAAEAAEAARSHLQVPHDARYKVEFDTKQILDDVRIPRGNFGAADYLEPLTKDFPEFGVGGATQAVTTRGIFGGKVVDLSDVSGARGR